MAANLPDHPVLDAHQNGEHPTGAVRRIAEVDRRAVGPAREVTDTALARAESGLLLAVIG